MPAPKATGSQGSKRPGATSATAHSDTRPRSRARLDAALSGTAAEVRRRAASTTAARAPLGSPDAMTQPQTTRAHARARCNYG